MSGFVIQSLKARTAVTLNTNVEYERLTKVPACRSTGSEPICTLSVQLLKEANPSYKRRSRQPWSTADVRILRQLAPTSDPFPASAPS
jgi:hypothetical protein